MGTNAKVEYVGCARLFAHHFITREVIPLRGEHKKCAHLSGAKFDSFNLELKSLRSKFIFTFYTVKKNKAQQAKPEN